MNKLWIDWILCATIGIITGSQIVLNWKTGMIFLLITIIFHIWRCKNWDRIYDALAVIDGTEEKK